MLQAQSIEDFSLCIIAQALPCHFLENILEGHKVEAAVHEVSAGLEITVCFAGDVLHQRIRAWLTVAL